MLLALTEHTRPSWLNELREFGISPDTETAAKDSHCIRS